MKTKKYAIRKKNDLARPQLRNGHLRQQRRNYAAHYAHYKNVIDKLSYEDRIELYLQLEVLQGIRRSNSTSAQLSPRLKNIVTKYESIPQGAYKHKLTEKMKKNIYISLKNSINTRSDVPVIIEKPH